MGDQKKKIKKYQAPPHAPVLDPTQKKPKGVGILGRDLKKGEKKKNKGQGS
jgi:hypothetical protein